MELNKTEVKAQIKAVEDKGGSAVRITFYNFLNDTIITFGVTKISIEECNWYKTVF